MKKVNFHRGTPKNRAISWGILLLSASMMLYGLMQGEAEAVLHKAVRICLECIGIG